MLGLCWIPRRNAKTKGTKRKEGEEPRMIGKLLVR